MSTLVKSATQESGQASWLLTKKTTFGDAGFRRSSWSRIAEKWAIVLWTIASTFVLIRAVVQPQKHNVYLMFASGSREWNQGIDPFDMNASHGGMDPFRYAPIVAVALTPLSLLPDSIGGLIWRIINIVTFFGGLAAFSRCVFPGDTAARSAYAGWIGLLIIPLALGSFNNGQSNLLIVGFLLLGTAAVARDRLNLAALCLTVPVLLKVYPVAIIMLLALVRPGLSWRAAIAISLGVAAPFAFQNPEFVAQCYRSWIDYVRNDNRHVFPVEAAYRDFHALLRQLGWTLEERAYQVIQLLTAGLMALIVLRARRNGLATGALLRMAYDLGICWIMVFGPATENATFALLAPTFAFATWEAFQPGKPRWRRLLTATALIIFVCAGMSRWFPDGKALAVLPIPIAAVIVFTERTLAHLRRTQPVGFSTASP